MNGSCILLFQLSTPGFIIMPDLEEEVQQVAVTTATTTTTTTRTTTTPRRTTTATGRPRPTTTPSPYVEIDFVEMAENFAFSWDKFIKDLFNIQELSKTVSVLATAVRETLSGDNR